MKFLKLDLRTKIFIVEIPKLQDYEFINRDSKYLRVGKEEVNLNIPTLSKMELICKGSDFTEEIAMGFVQAINVGTSLQYIPSVDFYNKVNKTYYNTALKTFIAAIKAYGHYWGENPVEFDDSVICFNKRYDMRVAWEQAESHTFKLEKTLIFEIQE